MRAGRTGKGREGREGQGRKGREGKGRAGKDTSVKLIFLNVSIMVYGNRTVMHGKQCCSLQGNQLNRILTVTAFYGALRPFLRC